MTDTQQETYAAKIEKLLRRAEHPNTPQPEADACIAKAQELMQIYAIDEAMIAAARGELAPDKIIKDKIDFLGSYRHALFDIGMAVAKANNCRVMITKNQYVRGESKPATRMHLIGFESDIKRVQLLTTSLEIQCAVALKAWWKENRETYRWETGMGKYKVKRDFVFGFAVGLGHRLAEANRAARAEAAQHETERTGATSDVATKGVGLVLASREAQVKDWYDTKYGKSSRPVSRNYASGSGGGHSAGRDAGRRADLNQTKVGGSRKAIG